MNHIKAKAILLSIAAHLLVAFTIIKVSYSRSEARGYPQIVTAMLIKKTIQKSAPKRTIAPPKQTPLPSKPAPVKKETTLPKRKETIPQQPAQPIVTKDTTTTRDRPSSTGTIRLDAPEFPFPHYLTLLQFRIENQWRPPYSGRGQFLATVHFIIHKSGEIQKAEIEKSSGNFAFDQSALRAVHNSNPLPALPTGANLETLGVHFDFVADW